MTDPDGWDGEGDRWGCGGGGAMATAEVDYCSDNNDGARLDRHLPCSEKGRSEEWWVNWIGVAVLIDVELVNLSKLESQTGNLKNDQKHNNNNNNKALLHPRHTFDVWDADVARSDCLYLFPLLWCVSCEGIRKEKPWFSHIMCTFR